MSGVDRLEATLVELGAEPCRPGQLFSPDSRPAPPPRVCRRPLRFAGHFDPDIQLFLFDPIGGTLGVVRWLEAGSATVRDVVCQAVDQATYLRHLLIHDEHRPTDHRVLAIELVVALPEAISSAATEALVAIERRSPSYLEAIGVNLLGHDVDSWSTEHVERVFPWLFLRSRRWFASQPTIEPGTDPSDATDAPFRRLRSIRLRDYRLAGTYELALAPGHRVHCVHGRNGSGKSTISEAIEWLLIGQLERFERQARDLSPEAVSDVVVHADPANAAGAIEEGTIEFGWEEGSSMMLRFAPGVGVSRLDEPWMQDSVATSFRLDQFTMERLGHSDEAQRALIFLESFFPDEAAAIRDYRDADRAYRQARQAVGTSGYRPSADPAESAQLPVTVDDWFEQCLPVSLETLGQLVLCDPELAPVRDRWRDGQAPPSEDDLQPFDERWAALSAQIDTWRAWLREADAALDLVAEWVVGGEDHGETGGFRQSLDEWLELSALIDLAEKQVEIVLGLSRARRDNWQKQDLPQLFERMPSELSRDRRQLAESLADWRQRRDELISGLRARQRSSEERSGDRSEDVGASRRRLLADDLQALDHVGEWICRAVGEEGGDLGQRIFEALRSGEERTFGTVRIGATGWADALREVLDGLRPALDEVAEIRQWSSVRRRQTLMAWAAAGKRLAVARSAAEGAFVQRLTRDRSTEDTQDLEAALNELLRLTTPAQWAYPDLGLEYRDGGEPAAPGSAPRPTVERPASDVGALRLGVAGSETAAGEHQRADLRFNTAELNLFTVALYLLCGPRVRKNRLRLLVFDDPLQNMDELTVTTFARALARLLPYVPEDWELLFLFHGEDDLQRFRAEVPAAIYRLDWLRRGEPGQAVEIEAEPQSLKPDVHWPVQLVTAVPEA